MKRENKGRPVSRSSLVYFICPGPDGLQGFLHFYLFVGFDEVAHFHIVVVGNVKPHSKPVVTSLTSSLKRFNEPRSPL